MSLQSRRHQRSRKFRRLRFRTRLAVVNLSIPKLIAGSKIGLLKNTRLNMRILWTLGAFLRRYRTAQISLYSIVWTFVGILLLVRGHDDGRFYGDPSLVLWRKSSVSTFRSYVILKRQITLAICFVLSRSLISRPSIVGCTLVVLRIRSTRCFLKNDRETSWRELEFEGRKRNHVWDVRFGVWHSSEILAWAPSKRSAFYTAVPNGWDREWSRSLEVLTHVFFTYIADHLCMSDSRVCQHFHRMEEV